VPREKYFAIALTTAIFLAASIGVPFSVPSRAKIDLNVQNVYNTNCLVIRS
jgi:hypothetical protein